MGMTQSQSTKNLEEDIRAEASAEVTDLDEFCYENSLTAVSDESDKADLDSFEVVDIPEEIPTIRNENRKILGRENNEVTPEEAPKVLWKHEISQDVRNYNVFLLVESSKPYDLNLNPQRLLALEGYIQNVCDCAKHIEEEIFNSAESKLDYLNMIFEKICSVKRILEENREREKLKNQLEKEQERKEFEKQVKEEWKRDEFKKQLEKERERKEFEKLFKEEREREEFEKQLEEQRREEFLKELGENLEWEEFLRNLEEKNQRANRGFKYLDENYYILE